MYRHLDALGRWLVTVTYALGSVAALMAITSLLLGVFYRYVLEDSLTWSDEVALLAFTWTVFLFASVLVRDFGHVRVTLLLDALPQSAAEVLERLILLLILIFGALMLWTGWGFVALTDTQVSAAIRYPLWVQNAAVPVAGALISFHALVLLVQPTSIRDTTAATNG